MYSKDEFRQGVINMRNRDSKLRNEGEYWTDEERRQLAANYIGGMGITEMAILFQRSEQAICQQLAVLGLFNNPVILSCCLPVSSHSRALFPTSADSGISFVLASISSRTPSGCACASTHRCLAAASSYPPVCSSCPILL